MSKAYRSSISRIRSAPATVRAIGAACRDWGFFQAVGHGVEPRLIASVQRQMRAFFAQPLAAKQAIERSAENPWGFYDRELTRHTPDWKQIYDVGPAVGRGDRAAMARVVAVVQAGDPGVTTTRATRFRCGYSERSL